MRIAFTGGGTGGHFYPLVAVAEAIEVIVKERTLIAPQLYYVGPTPFDTVTLHEHDIAYISSPAGKMRSYAGPLGFIFGGLKTFAGIISSITQLFSLYPDVIFSTGGYAAFPTLFAARILNIPVVIYDADAHPGKVSLWSSKFAMWIAVAHPDAAAQFPAHVRDRIARTGHPIRYEVEGVAKEGGHEFLHLQSDVPTIFITGGSQGARAINETILDALPELVQRYNVIHQVGANNLDETKRLSEVVLRNVRFADRYRVFGLLNALAWRMSSGIASLIVARAGSGTIFEIASWGLPSILVPIPPDISHDQTENAFSYARAGACIVIEQANLKPHVLIAEVDRIMGDAALREKMGVAAKAFSKPDAAHKIAAIILETALSHEAA